MRYTKNTLNKVINARKNITDSTTQCNFRKQYKCLEGKGLNPNQITILSYIYDTLELSWTNGDKYYDTKRHNYYAVITRRTISDLYNIGESTVGEVLQQLEDIGYIKKVHCLKGGLRVFPLHFYRTKYDTLNSSDSKRSNSSSNNIHASNTQSNTCETSSVSPQENKPSEQQQSNQDIKSSKRNKEFQEQNKLISLKQSLLNKHVPEQVLKVAMQFYSKSKDIHHIFGNLFKAKKSAKRYATKNPQKVFKSMQVYGFAGDKEQIKKAFNFESNNGMIYSLADAFRVAIFQAHKTADNFDAYSVASLKDYFLKCARKQVDKYALKLQANEPNKIPMFQI